jgi:DNA primase
MDVIDFIMYKEQINKHEAILKASTMLNGSTPSMLNHLAKIEPTDTELLEEVFAFFKNSLKNSDQAKSYLNSRAIDHKNIETGYNNGTFYQGKQRTEDFIQRAINAGLLQADPQNGTTRFKVFGKQGICFALRDEQNRITGLYFRSIVTTMNHKENNDQKHFYLKNRKGVYPGYPSKGCHTLFITEAIIDAAGLQNDPELQTNIGSYAVLSCFGTNGLTKEHEQAIVSWSKENPKEKEVVFFFDGDQAGEKGVEKYATLLHELCKEVTISKINTPSGEDVNSLQINHPREMIKTLYQNRDFLFSTEKESTMNNTPQHYSETTINQMPELQTEMLEIQSEIQPNPEQQPTPTETPKPNKEQSRFNATNPNQLEYQGEEATYYIKGFKIEQTDSLKVTLQVRIEDRFYSSKPDLYEHKLMESYARTAAERLKVDQNSIENDLYRLTMVLEEYAKNYIAPRKEEQKREVPAHLITGCINFLKSDHLLEKINELIGKAGIVGEEQNRLLLFVVASSYRMNSPLHALIQGSSGSGKTRLLKVISHLMPSEDVKHYTRVTDNSFYNQEEYFFVNKLVCFEDLDGLKEDAQLAVRELQSNDILITSTSIKDTNGTIRGGERIVRGPIASLACTTKGDIYEDNVSRSFLIAVDESVTQTRKVITYQNQLSAGIIDMAEQQKVIRFMQNCIRLLQPYTVINPYAHKILLPEQAHKIRRLNELYQCFVQQITWLNQYRREKDSKGRLISEKEDLQLGCDILFESIMLKVDELEGTLRQFFEKLKEYVIQKSEREKTDKTQTCFNRFEVREATMTGKTQQHGYIQRLVNLEYIRQDGYANRGFTYRICYWDNMSLLRSKIKASLENQLKEL